MILSQRWAKFLFQDFVRQSEDPTLQGVYNDVLETYIGEHGFLEVHRNKAYGYLNAAMKLGRLKTVGGFDAREHKECPWAVVSDKLHESQQERQSEKVQSHCPMGFIANRKTIHTDDGAKVRQVTVAISNSGLSYTAGDRLKVFPKNPADLILRTIQALEAKKTTKISLTPQWQSLIPPSEFDVTQTLSLYPMTPPGPVVMIAIGSGIAPFRSFWQARSHQEDAGENYLFLGTSTPPNALL